VPDDGIRQMIELWKFASFDKRNKWIIINIKKKGRKTAPHPSRGGPLAYLPLPHGFRLYMYTCLMFMYNVYIFSVGGYNSKVLFTHISTCRRRQISLLTRRRRLARYACGGEAAADRERGRWIYTAAAAGVVLLINVGNRIFVGDVYGGEERPMRDIEYS